MESGREQFRRNQHLKIQKRSNSAHRTITLQVVATEITVPLKSPSSSVGSCMSSVATISMNAEQKISRPVG